MLDQPYVKLKWEDGFVETISCQQVSQAWEWLSQPDDQCNNPPRHLCHLSQEAWQTLLELLEETLEEQSESQLH